MTDNTPQDDDMLLVGRTAWSDAEHWPCHDTTSCPYGHGNLPRPDNDSTLFGIRPTDRRRHLMALGATGQGKSTLLYNMLVSDIAAGRGVALIDPHGDLADSLLSAIPPSRTREVVYFNPADLAHPVGLNILESVDPDWHFFVADSLISVFRNLWSDSWGPRLEHIFHAAVLSLLQVEGSTLLGVPRLLTDKHYRAWVTSKLTDPVLARFWSHEFEPLSTTQQREATSSILNKVGQFLMAPPLRHIVGQGTPRLDIGSLMDGSGIFIANLSKGRLGEHHSMLLGSLLIAKFFLSALKRADRPAEERPDFFLTADEVHNLASDMLADILSEARKYHVSLTGATQSLEKLTPAVRSAILANVGTTIVFRVGPEDAALLEPSFAPRVTAHDLQATGRHEFYIKLGINDAGVTLPFHATSLPPMTPGYRVARRERIIQSSRERWGARREAVERSIAKWLALQGPVKEERRGTRHATPHPQPPSHWWKRVTP